MVQRYEVPAIYSDMSNQSQGYFAFRFTCYQCHWAVDTKPTRSTVSTVSNVMDIGVGMLGGFWGRAAEAGEQIYGSKFHQEQAEALQKAWAEIKQEFHYCPKCFRTVCIRCFNMKLNLCTSCVPDLQADGASFQHDLSLEAQRQQIQAQYQAPQFNVAAIPSAVNPEQLRPQPGQQPPPQVASPSAAAIAGFATPGFAQSVACPKCRRPGPPGKFCQDCGAKLPFNDLFCPSCANPVENATRFCPECGTKLHQGT